MLQCLSFPFFSAIFQAMYHDGSSGGVCRIGIITKDGIERRIYYAPEAVEHMGTPSAPVVFLTA
jgi:20S proteasome subunit beta 1